MKKYIDEIYNNIKIREGKKVIEKILLIIYFNEGISTKEIARESLLPIPIAAAIKKEFIKKGLVVQSSGSRLTVEGKYYVEEELGFKGINKELYKDLSIESYKKYTEISELIDNLENIFNNRPEVNVSIDQSKANVETSVKRAILAIKNDNLIGKKILCLGDDDLVSVAIAFLIKKLLNDVNTNKSKIYVLDIDTRITDYIKSVAQQHNLPIECINVDLRNNILSEYINSFDCVYTDPPYTIEGMDLFLSRAIDMIKKDSGLNIYLSYGHKSPDFQLDMQRRFIDMGLVVSEINNRFNNYEGASILASTGQLIILETTDLTQTLIKGSYNGNLYTGDLREIIRFYQCKKCKKIYKIGKNEKIKNIEELKLKKCSNCKEEVFVILKKSDNKKTINSKRIGRL